MTKIKLCGLKRIEDIEAANKLDPEFVGFVFATGSRRYISKNDACFLRSHLKKTIATVGVFKDNELEEIADIVKSNAISVVQLHGNESDDFIIDVKKICGCKVIKAFGIASSKDIDVANKSVADYVLLDAPGGGTGNIFDHKFLTEMKRQYFLAGGLGSDNVAELIKNYKPYAVDVSSKIETDGVKDLAKMKAFVNAVRNTGMEK